MVLQLHVAFISQYCRMTEATFSVEAVVRGYHVYHEIWDATVGEQLTRRREPGNSRDPFAVSIIKTSTIVGHVPRKISSVCSLFLQHGGMILCRVTGTRQYSEDLPQGGMELPCILTFQGDSRDIIKAKKLIKLGLEMSMPTVNEKLISDTGDSSGKDSGGEKLREKSEEESTGSIEASNGVSEDRSIGSGEKKTTDKSEDESIGEEKITDRCEDKSTGNGEEKTGCNGSERRKRRLDNYHLNEVNLNNMIRGITQGDKLSDREIDFSQYLLKCQFPQLKGLQSTLLQSKKPKYNSVGNNQIQILHSRSDHWTVASNVGAGRNVVHVYDSAFSTLDKNTEQVVLNLFRRGNTEIIVEMIKVQQQTGGRDCGLFAIAVGTALANGLDPSQLEFVQDKMRDHLASCFKDRELKLFPTK